MGFSRMWYIVYKRMADYLTCPAIYSYPYIHCLEIEWEIATAYYPYSVLSKQNWMQTKLNAWWVGVVLVELVTTSKFIALPYYQRQSYVYVSTNGLTVLSKSWCLWVSMKPSHTCVYMSLYV